MSEAKQPAAAKVDKSATEDKAADAGNDNFRLLADIPVRLSVEVGSVSKRLADIMAFRESEVIELDRQSDDLLDIKVNGTLVAKGEVVTIDGRFGVRIAELADVGASFPAIERR
ncbi:MAG: flagellar motor switch protein FliN [Sphingorhabdus sp.]|jgi:flagellar motor switch protein FliN/FliY|nr:flagellar motor switch protein FliN [Sphingorhabdus sp.]